MRLAKDSATHSRTGSEATTKKMCVAVDVLLLLFVPLTVRGVAVCVLVCVCARKLKQHFS